MSLQRTIKATIRHGEQSGYVAECLEIPVVSEGQTLDEVTRNLREAVELHLEGENLAELGLAPSPTILGTFELEPHPKEITRTGDVVVQEPEVDDHVVPLPAFEKLTYLPVFANPDGTLTGFSEDYYLAALAIAERITEGRTLGDTEGIAALFLFRHYLELALKNIVFDLRRLETRRRNVPTTKLLQPPSGHRLGDLWNEIKAQYPRKMGQRLWNALDALFAEQCVLEFDRIDPSGERFRYSLEKNAPQRDPLKLLGVSWDRFPHTIRYVHDVLRMMDTWLVETHAQNQDWEAEMNSW
jgi:predicted RNase H-like HicB family nuclease